MLRTHTVKISRHGDIAPRFVHPSLSSVISRNFVPNLIQIGQQIRKVGQKVIYARQKRLASTAPILTKLIIAQYFFVEIPYNRFHPNWTKILANA